jgi:hypothetical protein
MLRPLLPTARDPTQTANSGQPVQMFTAITAPRVASANRLAVRAMAWIQAQVTVKANRMITEPQKTSRKAVEVLRRCVVGRGRTPKMPGVTPPPGSSSVRYQVCSRARSSSSTTAVMLP